MGCPEKLWMPILRGVQGKAGWDPGQTDLEGGIPANSGVRCR